MNYSVILAEKLKHTFWYRKRHSNRVLLGREVIPLVIPILIENLCVLLMGVLSTFLVSWLGKEAVAAVGLADSFNMVILAFFTAVDLGTTVVVAFNLGRRNRKQARTAARQSIALLTLVSVLIAVVIEFIGPWIIDLIANQAEPEVKTLALSYLRVTVWSYPPAAMALIGCGALRGAGNTKLPMVINIAMNIFNIVISAVLIYGCLGWHGLGFVGAGIGLTVSRYIGAAMVLMVLRSEMNHTLRLPLKSYFTALNPTVLLDVLSIGLPASVESVLFNAGKLVTQIFVAGMGTDVIAGNFIAFSIVSLINLPGNALGSSSTIIVGTRLGKGQIRQPIRQLKFIFGLSNFSLCLLALCSVPMAGLLAAFYTNDPDVIQVVKYLVWLNALFMPFWAASWVLPLGLKGARDARYTMWVSMVSMWGCRIVSGYALGIYAGLGVYGVWLGMFLDWILRGALFYRRMASGHWLWRYNTRGKVKAV
ncbi:EmmdR/YeeO family multidrug/toxin efflux MATE transporter [Martelella alba]|uniref:EmmdR/YeeO family multidrug/toxin efflux MATE transporter n=1 Tax=Martelella alba TaxID=2590451 RepID=UPI0026B016B8|nr:EmmdR/YeeO family multidrug/toxin efflux MATE transporter [Martelella alba]